MHRRSFHDLAADLLFQALADLPKLRYGDGMKPLLKRNSSLAKTALVPMFFRRGVRRIWQGMAKAIAVGFAPALVLVATCWLTNCASSPPVSLPVGSRWQEVVTVAGLPTATFSYQTNGRKYDLVRFENAATPVVFEDARLFVVVPEAAMADWDRRVMQGLQPGQLPFAAGVGPLHAWVVALRKSPPTDAPAKTTGVGEVAEAAACGLILAPMAPLFLAGGVCAGVDYAMTGKDRDLARRVNEALLASDSTYRGLLAHLPKPIIEVGTDSYRVGEYYVSNSAFSATKYYYDVGTRRGKVEWVAYQVDPIRQHTHR